MLMREVCCVGQERKRRNQWIERDSLPRGVSFGIRQDWINLVKPAEIGERYRQHVYALEGV
jgi:hypothetical protein